MDQHAVLCYGSPDAPRPEELVGLEKAGVETKRAAAAGGSHWALDLRHPTWGEARLEAGREALPFDPLIIDHTAGLFDPDRERARSAKSTLDLRMPRTSAPVARRRKHLLRFAQAALGTAGIYVMDASSLHIWMPDALEDELAHDAELDVSSLYSLHAVTDGTDKVRWLHTHGLEECGGFDFDVLDPSKDLMTLAGEDVLRTIAFASVEGILVPDTTISRLVNPGPALRMVPVDVFQARAEPALAALRMTQDHDGRRCVVCDAKPWWDFPGWTRPRPSRLLRELVAENIMIGFLGSATETMAERARATLGILRQVVDMGGRQYRAVVKIGVPIAGEDDREHCWFELQAIREKTIVGRIAHDAIYVPLKMGDTAEYPIELLTDWVVPMPFTGAVTPRNLRYRKELEKIKQTLLKHLPDPKSRPTP